MSRVTAQNVAKFLSKKEGILVNSNELFEVRRVHNMKTHGDWNTVKAAIDLSVKEVEQAIEYLPIVASRSKGGLIPIEVEVEGAELNVIYEFIDNNEYHVVEVTPA